MRMLIAGCIAVLAFLLPQELPLEWYPLNEPGDDINLLQITFAARKDGEVRLLYDVGRGFNEAGTIRIPVSSQARLPYTYTFPLPDAPLQELRLHPLPEGGVMEIWELRIVNRAGREIRRFHRGHIAPLWGIAAVSPVAEGWTITSAPAARDPVVQLRMDAPEIPAGMNARNLQRVLRSSGYVAGMLGLILLTLLVIVERPSGWRSFAATVSFIAWLALLFAAVANRELIRDSIRHAAFRPPDVAPGLFLEIDLASERPSLAQLFWDTGGGFNEAESHRLELERHQGRQTLRLPLPNQPLQSLRFDPATQEDRFNLTGLRVTDRAGRTRATLPVDSLLAERDIFRTAPVAGGLRIHTLPGSGDPILRFTEAATALINRQRTASP